MNGTTARVGRRSHGGLLTMASHVVMLKTKAGPIFTRGARVNTVFYAYSTLLHWRPGSGKSLLMRKLIWGTSASVMSPMRHKCPKNEPENRLFTTSDAKTPPAQSLTMSHDETFMSHRETSNASGYAPEIRRTIGNAFGNRKRRSENPKVAGNCLSGAPSRPRFGPVPAIGRGKWLSRTPGPPAHFSCRCRPAPALRA